MGLRERRQDVRPGEDGTGRSRHQLAVELTTNIYKPVTTREKTEKKKKNILRLKWTKKQNK